MAGLLGKQDVKSENQNQACGVCWHMHVCGSFSHHLCAAYYGLPGLHIYLINKRGNFFLPHVEKFTEPCLDRSGTK